ncbi:MAG: DUF5076 domain-containing protein [Gemmataceae bacterium]
MSALPTPPEGAVELLRAWLDGESLECSVRAGAFEDPALWGAVLADLARYVAMGLHQEEGTPPAQTLTAIRQTFHEELDQPTRESP